MKVLMDSDKTLEGKNVTDGGNIQGFGHCSIDLVPDTIRVRFMHPQHNNMADVDVPRNLTMSEVCEALIESNYITERTFRNEYMFWVNKAGTLSKLDMDKTLEENGVERYSVIRIKGAALPD